MCQFQRTGLQGANNPQWLPHDDILDVFAPDLGLEAVSHVGVSQALDALRQRTVEDDVERVFVVARAQGLGFALAGLAEPPGFFVERALPPVFAATTGGSRGEVPAVVD